MELNGKNREIILQRNKSIKEKYLIEIKLGKKSDDVMDAISSEHDVGRFYIRTILKEQGVEIERKSEYNKHNKIKLVTRDAEIVDMFNKKINPDDISKKFMLTSTRVRQILRAKGNLVKSHKIDVDKTLLANINETVEKIKKDLSSEIPYTEIVKKYGKDKIKEIKETVGFNVFKTALTLKIKNIVKLARGGVPPKEIAAKHSVTLNYTYMILHDNGIRYKISKSDKKKRDHNIFEESKKKTIDEIATKYKLTPTMIRIIISQVKKLQK